jgi:DmsE family decaheme c-type cytochrome
MAHVDAGGDPDMMESFGEKSALQIAEACLTCHSGSARQKLFAGSQHMAGDVSCTQCHAMHYPEVDEGLMTASPPALCFDCHAGIKAAFGAVERHGVHSEVNDCDDCHNPHGTPEPAMLTGMMINGELCARCHIDKRGPFVFEHSPRMVEGCTACHGPHGSGNRFMLKMNTTRELCISCHIEAPTFHNLADPRYRDCTTCHTSIHGSDSHRLFFRR